MSSSAAFFLVRFLAFLTAPLAAASFSLTSALASALESAPACAAASAAPSRALRPGSPMPRAARILFSISSASSGLSFRKVRAFYLPWQSW